MTLNLGAQAVIIPFDALGVVIGIAQYVDRNPEYLMRFKDIRGEVREVWCTEQTLKLD